MHPGTLSDKLRLHCKLSLPGVVWTCKEKGAKKPRRPQNADQRQAKTGDRVVLRDTCRNVSPGDCGF